MKPTTPDRIRNVALISHGGAGKTSLAEAMLFDAGAIQRLGSVDAGTATLDHDPDEQKRKQSINLAIGTLEADGSRITLVDTPGYADFQSDVIEALAAVDAAVVVVDASAGVEVGTEAVWRLAEERKLPRFVFINKMDRENANFDAVLDQLKARFGPKIAPVYLPIGSAEGFKGYVDVIEQHANVYEGGTPKEAPIPDEMRAGEEQRREALVEAAAEASDELMNKYLEGEEISDAEIEAALHKGTREGSVVPVFVGSALKNIGVRELTAMIAKHVPSAAEVGGRTTTDGKQIAPDPSGPFVAQVFKTTADPFVGRLTYFRVVSGSLKAQDHLWNATHKEEERIGNMLGLMGKDQSNMAQVGPGDIVAVAKLASTQIGDTLVADRAHALELAKPTFPEPTLQVSIEPESQGRPGQAGPGAAAHAGGGAGHARAPRGGHRRDDPDRHGRRARGRHRRAAEAQVRRIGQDRHAARAVPRDHPQAHQDRQPLQAADRRPRPVRSRGHRVRADGVRLGLRVRQPHRGRRGAEAVHPRRREGPARGDGRGRAGRLPGGRHEGDPGRRQLPHRRLAARWRSRSPPRRRSSAPSRRPIRSCWSRSWRWRWSSPTSTWAT